MTDYSGRTTPAKQLMKTAKLEYVSDIPVVPPSPSIRAPAFAPATISNAISAGGAATVSSGNGVTVRIFPGGGYVDISFYV